MQGGENIEVNMALPSGMGSNLDFGSVSGAKLLFEPNIYSGTDIFGYSDTPLTVTVLVNPMLPKCVTVSKYLLTVTLFHCPCVSL